MATLAGILNPTSKIPASSNGKKARRASIVSFIGEGRPGYLFGVLCIRLAFQVLNVTVCKIRFGSKNNTIGKLVLPGKSLAKALFSNKKYVYNALYLLFFYDAY
ncbi:hypothetical protein [Vreelandella nanhaiensis]|uniref:hypothetical protein n=1 Tax=Vreelandella nanhaiensis TaxID=1258546 RepID=UPI00163B8951|nr:hypothetical protein [Halomonas nanhaiensis]